MMLARRLENLIKLACDDVGGTGVVGYDVSAYVADQVKEWSNTKERLWFAIRCFEGQVDLRPKRRTWTPTRINGTYGTSNKEAG